MTTIRRHLQSKSQNKVRKVTATRDTVLKSALLHTVNRYNYVKKERTLLLKFFIGKEY